MKFEGLNFQLYPPIQRTAACFLHIEILQPLCLICHSTLSLYMFLHFCFSFILYLSHCCHIVSHPSKQSIDLIIIFLYIALQREYQLYHIIQLQTRQRRLQVQPLITTLLIKIQDKKPDPVKQKWIYPLSIYQPSQALQPNNLFKSLNNLQTVDQSQGMGSVAWVASPRATLYQPSSLGNMKKGAYCFSLCD